MKTTILIIASALILTGCVSREQIHARHVNNCASYGFVQGTDGFAACMQGEYADRRADQRQRAANAANYFAMQNAANKLRRGY